MKHLWIVILVIFAIGQLADHCDALQNNLYYGNCAFDNNTLQVYTQVVVMDNQRQPIPSSPTPAPAQKPRKWYDYILHPFQRRTTTSPPPQPPAPFGQGNIINATVTYPPQGHKNLHLIKCIQVIDNITDGSGAIASIIEGGANQNHTKILLKSQPGGRINNKITIFAYKNPILPYQHMQPPIGLRAPHTPSYPVHPNAIHENPPHPNAIHQTQPQPSPHKPFFPWPHFHKKK